MLPNFKRLFFFILNIALFTGCELDQDLVSIFNDSTSETTEVPMRTENTPDNETVTVAERILVFTKTAEFRHSSITSGVELFSKFGIDNDFQVDQTEDDLEFNEENLASYQLVVFLNTTGDVLNTVQQNAFEKYIQAGGSYMGVHAATDTEYQWAWYGQLVGAYFDGHPEIQEASVDVIDNTHESTEHLSVNWIRTDEWYNFRDFNSNISVLLNLDETSYQGGANGENHPIAWYHEFDGGRSFYTGGGHGEDSYDEPDFQQHLLGGIFYCLDR